ncbi:hypothetical protein SAMN05216353_12040 [Halobacillus alkaliphilus]|uniref:Uncharacterized protein n=1 Tax=Halobacillus alkaliphilus TaxID=396056 RepID=A0A1I2NKM0_9BACI|nr:hypothetical protein SAMN05216353_12040 [Halobacillus alkaliphilus]
MVPFCYSRVRSQHYSWVGGEMMRLPWEKELSETPQGVLTTEEACQFPHRKASYFPTNPYPSNVTDPIYLETESSNIGSLSLLSRRFNGIFYRR